MESELSRQYVHTRDTGILEFSSSQRRHRKALLAPESEHYANKILAALPRHLIDELKPAMRLIRLSKDQIVYMQDARPDYVYFPETAGISEFSVLEDGHMMETALTGNDGALDIMAWASGSNVTHLSQVSQAGNVWRVESDALRAIARRHPDLVLHLTKGIDRYIKQISQRSICNIYHPLKKRVCTWLLMLQDKCGRGNLRLTHEQIARILGVYRPSITCITLELRRDGMIDYSRGGILISDRSRMADSACSCYAELGPAASAI